YTQTLPHIHTHAHTHARTHTHPHAHTHTRTHKLTALNSHRPRHRNTPCVPARGRGRDIHAYTAAQRLHVSHCKLAHETHVKLEKSPTVGTGDDHMYMHNTKKQCAH